LARESESSHAEASDAESVLTEVAIDEKPDEGALAEIIKL
jgi:hypothetical protein